MLEMKKLKVADIEHSPQPLTSTNRLKFKDNTSLIKPINTERKKPKFKELSATTTFQLPFITGKLRDVITKGKNYPTTIQRIGHRNNCIIIERAIQDAKLEHLFENAKAPRITVNGTGFTIHYQELNVVITVQFKNGKKLIGISKDGAAVLRK